MQCLVGSYIKACAQCRKCNLLITLEYQPVDTLLKKKNKQKIALNIKGFHININTLKKKKNFLEQAPGCKPKKKFIKRSLLKKIYYKIKFIRKKVSAKMY